MGERFLEHEAALTLESQTERCLGKANESMAAGTSIAPPAAA